MKHFLILGLCFFITACGYHTTEFYVPIHNENGKALPVSTTDIVRVIINENNAGQPSGISNHETLLKTAKQATEKHLLELGYTVINTGTNTNNTGHPTLIALIQSGQKGATQTIEKTWKKPIFTDSMGRVTLWGMDGTNISFMDLYYTISIIRPQNQNNPLLQCHNTVDSMCSRPDVIENYDVVFKSAATLKSDNIYKGMQSLVSAVFYQFPLTGNKKIYFNNLFRNIIRVEDSKPYNTQSN